MQKREPRPAPPKSRVPRKRAPTAHDARFRCFADGPAVSFLLSYNQGPLLRAKVLAANVMPSAKARFRGVLKKGRSFAAPAKSSGAFARQQSRAEGSAFCL